MEICIVCLESNTDTFSRISTESSEWIASKMRNIIEKHLWWWYLESSSYNNVLARWICCECWQEISSFNRFYVKIERAHRNFHKIMSLSNPGTKRQEEEIICKLEEYNSVKSTAELKLPEERQRKENIEQLAECMDNFEEEIISIVEIKNEMCVSPIGREINDESDNTSNLNNENAFDEKQSDGHAPLTNKTTETTNTERVKLKENLVFQTVPFDSFFVENKYKLECCICNVTFPDFASLKPHYRNEHNTPGYSICCGKKYFKRCFLVDHLKLHADPNFFKCHLCTKTYKTRRSLKKHSDETHQIREPTFNCDDCGKSFFKLHVFESHKLIHIPESEKKYNCLQCEKKFATDYLRLRHVKFSHSKKYARTCNICGKTYCNNSYFLRHMEEHAGIRRAKETCNICRVRLSDKKGLMRHMKMRHQEENLSTEKEQICPHCSKVLRTMTSLLRHIKYNHTMRKHVCQTCKKAFRRAVELKEHLPTHTGETLYTCHLCPQTFISNSNMHKHLKIVHRKDREHNRINKLNQSGAKIVSNDVGGKSVDAQKTSQDIVVSSESGSKVYTVHF